jgi:hypothetical protein
MLVNLCDYKQSVTLIANSGVQFLDFGLTPQDTASNGRFVRKTANGPLLRLDFDLVNGRYTLPGTNGGQPEVVKPETTIPLHQSLTVLDGVWLPVPFLRFNPPRTFVEGRITGPAFRCASLRPRHGRQYAPRDPRARQPDCGTCHVRAVAGRKRYSERHPLRAGLAR